MAECDHPTDEKCAECVALGAVYSATSFAELDAAREAADEARDIEGVMSDFRIISSAILESPDLSTEMKTTRLRAATEKLADRVKNPPQRKSLIDKAKDLFAGDKATKVEGGVTYQASDYADVPDSSTPSTWKLRLAEGSSGNVTVAQVARAITALQPGGFRGNRVTLGSSKSAVVSKISSAIGRAKGDADAKQKLRERLAKVKDLDADVDNSPGRFRVFKDVAGDWRWMAVYSNNLYDREGEVIPASEHANFIKQAEETGKYPELWLWHTPGTKVGTTDLLDLSSEGFAIAGGVFDTGAEPVAAALAEDKDLGVSHGFSYKEKTPDGQILGYRTFEISPLPLGRAANSYTGFLVGDKSEEDAMALTDDKRAFLVSKMGEEKVAALETGLGAAKETADAENVDFKDVLEALTPDDAGAQAAQDDAGGDEGGGEATTVEFDAEALGKALEPVLGAIQTLATAQAAQAEEIKALKGAPAEAPPEKEKTVADRVAEAMRPKGAGVFLASASDGNKVHGNSAEARVLKDGKPGDDMVAAQEEAMRPHAELMALVTGGRGGSGSFFNPADRVVGADGNDEGGES